MANLGEHQLSSRTDIDLGEGHPQRLGQSDGIAPGVLTSGEAGQGERQDVAARPAFGVHRLGRDDQRVGGIQASGDTDHDLGMVQRPQSLG